MKEILKQTDFTGTWGLKGPLIALALLFPLGYVIIPDTTRWSSYLYPIPYGLMILYLVATKKATWKQLGAHHENWRQNLILGGLAGGMVAAAVPLLDLSIQGSGMGQTELFAGAERRYLEESDSQISFAAYFLIVTGIALAEQLFFTGYLLQALIRKIKPALAIYLSGLIFAMVHLDLQLGVFLLGLIASSFYWLTGSLVAPLIFQIACHTASWLLDQHYPRVYTLLGFLF